MSPNNKSLLEENLQDIDTISEIKVDKNDKNLNETEAQSIDKELEKIRDRRLNSDKTFLVNTIVPRTSDDYTLIFGVICGAIFFGGIFITSSGLIAAESIVIDDKLSGTFFDSEDCTDRRYEVYFEIYSIDENIKIKSHHVDSTMTSILIVNLTNHNDIEGTMEYVAGGIGNQDTTIYSEEIKDGHYEIKVEIFIWDEEVNISNLSKAILLKYIDDGSYVDNLNKTVDLHMKSRVTNEIPIIKTLTLDKWGNSELQKIPEISDNEPRACMSVQQLGIWGWALMGLEWAGGRETAMLTGGTAGVPPWWLASVSLGMSIFFLCVQYPLMHRLYHREIDDLLSTKQMKRLLQQILQKSAKGLRIKLDMEDFKIQDRPLSIDALVPYKTSSKTIVGPVEVKTRMITDILSEFAIFGEMRPIQLKSVCTDKTSTDVSSVTINSELLVSEFGQIPLAEDYSDFFSSVSKFGKLEEEFRSIMKKWFRENNLVDYGSAIMSDEDSVFVRIIYQPSQRFAYFLFKSNFNDLQNDLKAYLNKDLKEYIGERTLIVSARNEKYTLADYANPGRVEQGTADLTGEAMVAKRGGIPGALLQNPFMGDILSSVEYVALKNRKRIDKYGFWGLIVFVWIPFMASGVLVGAMLGLVARMRFERVLAACLLGGSAASITWAYSAKGIIEFMEKYHAEAFIPFLIFLVFAFTIIHLRNNKRRRREELFRDSMS
ncbi:MAG: small multi-drug export protein, partial [Candidatus Poseidoniales archaeon]